MNSNQITPTHDPVTPPMHNPTIPLARWPAPDEVPEFFGRFELGRDGHPTDRWELRNLAQIRLPYPMRLAWQPEVTMIRLRCHKLVARDLGEILAGILAHYGSLAAVQDAGMDLFGGCYFYSAGTDPRRPSPHARGIAIDLDPFGNSARPRRPKNAAPTMPEAVVALFRSHGWSWGGDAADRYEPAHFEAISGPSPAVSKPGTNQANLQLRKAGKGNGLST